MIAMVVLTVVLVTIAMPALSGVLFGAFGGAGTLTAATTGLAAMAARVVSGLVLTAIMAVASRLLMGAPKNLNQSSFGRLNANVDPVANRKIVFGNTAGGTDERFHEMTNKSGNYIEESKDKGDYQHRVIAVASHKVHSIDQVWLDDELSYAGGVTGKYAAKSGLRMLAVNEGTHDNATPYGSGSYWTSASSFTGCAYIKMSNKLDSEVYPNGIPSRTTIIVRGCPVYDPRLDTTSGGSGTHRWNDQSTWSYLDGSLEIGRNPALSLLTYIIGYRINGRLAWGMGIPASRIDIGNFIQYANLCDEPVVSGEVTVKRYQADCILSTGDSHETNINIICGAMGSAKLIDAGGLYQFVGGYNDLDGPALTLTIDDIIGSQNWNVTVSQRQRYNIARGRFANPDKLYQFEDWGSIEVDAMPDGIPRTLSVDLAAVSRARACQRIAKQLLVRNAYTGTFTATFGPRAFAAQVGSLVRLVVPSRGWNQPGKLFRVVDQSEAADLIFQMTLQEEEAVIYAWDDDEGKDLPPNIRPPAYNPNGYTLVQDLSASARSILGANGQTTSQIDVTWQTPDSGVDCIQIEVREVGGDKWQTATDHFNHEVGAFTFAAMAGGIQHEVRARYQMYGGFFGEWTSVEVTSNESNGGSQVVGYLSDESVIFEADLGGNIY